MVVKVSSCKKKTSEKDLRKIRKQNEELGKRKDIYFSFFVNNQPKGQEAAEIVVNPGEH